MRKLKVAVVGLGFGHGFIRDQARQAGFASLFDICAVCDSNPGRLEAAQSTFQCVGYLDLAQLLAQEKLDAVFLFSGPNGRARIIRQIIRAGKDVMTTKPFEQDSHAAADVLAEARRLGCIVYLNSPAAVMNKDFETIRGWEKKYNLGRLVAGHHECWYKSVEQADGSWYDDPGQCPAAPILRLGIYGINDMVQFFGEPDEVQVMQTRLFTGRPTSDLARLCIKFKDGAMVDTMDGWVCQPGRGAQSLTLYYENGTVYRNPTMLPSHWDAPVGTFLCVVTKDCEDGMPVESVRLKTDELSSFYAWDAFYKAVTTRERSANETPDSAIVNAVRILEAVRRAVENGGMAKVVPASAGQEG